MENQPSDLRESLWRRKLSASERAGLSARPELALEASLTRALDQVPAAPVPSNFTARVMVAIELEEAQATRSRGWTWNWRLLLPRVAAVAAVLVFASVSLHHYTTVSHQTLLAKNVAQIAGTPQQPSMEALENLDVIQAMSHPAHADTDLLAALQ